jgi:hypothetical protein
MTRDRSGKEGYPMESPYADVIRDQQEMDFLRKGLATFMQFVSQKEIVTPELLARMRRDGGAFSAAAAVDKMFNPGRYQVRIPEDATGRSLADAARADHGCRRPFVMTEDEAHLVEVLESELEPIRGKAVEILLLIVGTRLQPCSANETLKERGYVGNIASAFIWLAEHRPAFDCDVPSSTKEEVRLCYRLDTVGHHDPRRGANVFVVHSGFTNGVFIGSRLLK